MKIFKCMMITILLSSSACVSFNGIKNAPKITNEMKVEEKLAHAIDFGGETFKDVSKSITDNDQWGKAEIALTSLILSNVNRWQESQLMNAAKLYERSGATNADLVFLKLIDQGSSMATQMAWQLLRQVEYKNVGVMVDKVLSEAVIDGTIENHLIPDMADTVAVLDIKSVYGILKLGLMKKGDPQFVAAMIKLYPVKSSDDLFDYLVLPNNDELRQRSLKTIDTITAIQILDRLETEPMSFGHKDLGKIFVYAASRNMAFRQTGRRVIDTLVSINPEILAFELSKQPKWAQMSLVESARRSMTSNTKLLLKHLKKMTPDETIEEEISLLRL